MTKKIACSHRYYGPPMVVWLDTAKTCKALIGVCSYCLKPKILKMEDCKNDLQGNGNGNGHNDRRSR